MEKIRPLFFNKNLLIIYSISLIAVMGVASLAPAFPKIIEFYKINPQKVGWLIAVFTFPGIVLTFPLGIVADRIGRKKVLIPSLFIFAIAGTSCGFIDDYKLLLTVRFIQGIGAASIGSLNVTLIGDIFEGSDRGKAMGHNASVISIGTASYPAIGGLLAGLGWNYPFFLSVLAIPVGLLVIYGLENKEPERSDKFWLYFKQALASMARFDVIILYLITFLIFIVLYGSILTYVPILLKQKFNSSSQVIGILLSGMSISMGIAASSTGFISRKLSPSGVLKIAACLYILSMLLIPLIPSVNFIIIPLLIYGFGNGLVLPTLQTSLAGKASLEQRGVFMSFNGMVLRAGQFFGPLLTGLAYLQGLSWAFWISIFVAFIILMTAFKLK